MVNCIYAKEEPPRVYGRPHKGFVCTKFSTACYENFQKRCPYYEEVKIEDTEPV